MLYILDTADLKEIRHANEFYPIVGVTTNPSIIAKEKTDFVGKLFLQTKPLNKLHDTFFAAGRIVAVLKEHRSGSIVRQISG